MRTDSFPHPVSDPASDGIPEYADDDSSAAGDGEAIRAADGPDPAPLPNDRDALQAGADRFGTTAEEQRDGESLDRKLGREVPDPALSDVPAARPDATDSPIAVEAFDPDSENDTLDRVDEGTVLADEGPVDPQLDSPVSMYDRPLGDGSDLGEVGRLVETDEGGPFDAEKDAVAYDAGPSGGGASAEELAMHEVREP